MQDVMISQETTRKLLDHCVSKSITDSVALTSLSRVLVLVVMTPVSGLMANRSNPSNRVYLILTCLVPSLSRSVAFTLPTTSPVVQNVVMERHSHLERQKPQHFRRIFSYSSPALLFSGTVNCSGFVNVGALSLMSSTSMVMERGTSVSFSVFLSITLVSNCLDDKKSIG